MKIFIDTADVDAIRRAAETGLVDGVTTNPSVIAKSGRDFKEVVRQICQMIPGPVSAEGNAEGVDALVEEAREIAKISPNIVVKILMSAQGMKAVEILEAENIKTNVTMVFSPTQAHLAMKARASYVSIVLSRLDAICNESDALVVDTMRIKKNYGFNSEIIAGSMKTQNHLLSCLRQGVDIVTIPDSLFFQMFKHPLTDAAEIEFKRDWQKFS